MNFDGALKGNLRSIDFGGTMTNSGGEIMQVYFGYIVEETNNAAKMEALLTGLKLVILYMMEPLFIEGDSQVIVQMEMDL